MLYRLPRPNQLASSQSSCPRSPYERGQSSNAFTVKNEKTRILNYNLPGIGGLFRFWLIVQEIHVYVPDCEAHEEAC